MSCENPDSEKRLQEMDENTKDMFVMSKEFLGLQAATGGYLTDIDLR
jgi:hypothetical protein